MNKIKLNVLFKKMQKDDKKEVLEFHVVGDKLPHTAELNEMAGNMVVLNVGDAEGGNLPAEFNKFQRDSKKTVLQFKVKGDSDELSAKMYSVAGSNVSLFMEPSQISADEFWEEPREGVKVQVEKDGTATVIDDKQMTLDDVEDPEELTENANDDDSLE